jgi:phosphoglycerate dehydrogenase-like enzyme
VNAVFCGTGWLNFVEVLRERLPAGVTVTVRPPGGSLADAVRDAEVILPSNARLDAAAIDAAPRLRLIQQPAVGYEGIDLAAARARGIPVCNAPGVNGAAVAETALFLILALARRLPLARKTFAAGIIGAPTGVELDGKILGVIGAGGSGSRLARTGEALGMRVLTVRSTSPPSALEDLLAQADVISIHCPLTERTAGLLGEAAFARMKPGVLLVNCARGGIIDRPALERALAVGRLGGFGADTFWVEPWDAGDPLYARDDVVTLPHIGGSTRETFERLATLVAGNIARVLRGEPPLHRVA